MNEWTNALNSIIGNILGCPAEAVETAKIMAYNQQHHHCLASWTFETFWLAIWRYSVDSGINDASHNPSQNSMSNTNHSCLRNAKNKQYVEWLHALVSVRSAIYLCSCVCVCWLCLCVFGCVCVCVSVCLCVNVLVWREKELEREKERERVLRLCAGETSIQWARKEMRDRAKGKTKERQKKRKREREMELVVTLNSILSSFVCNFHLLVTCEYVQYEPSRHLKRNFIFAVRRFGHSVGFVYWDRTISGWLSFFIVPGTVCNKHSISFFFVSQWMPFSDFPWNVKLWKSRIRCHRVLSMLVPSVYLTRQTAHRRELSYRNRNTFSSLNANQPGWHLVQCKLVWGFFHERNSPETRMSYDRFFFKCLWAINSCKQFFCVWFSSNAYDYK